MSADVAGVADIADIADRNRRICPLMSRRMAAF
jgi:hypothetical protein